MTFWLVVFPLHIAVLCVLSLAGAVVGWHFSREVLAKDQGKQNHPQYKRLESTSMTSLGAWFLIFCAAVLAEIWL